MQPNTKPVAAAARDRRGETRAVAGGERGSAGRPAGSGAVQGRPVEPDLPAHRRRPAVTSCAASRPASCCPRRTRSTANTASSRRWRAPTCRCAQCYALCEDESVIGTMFYIMDYVEGRIALGPARCRACSRPSARAIFRRDEPRHRRAALGRLRSRRASADYGKPGNYFARQIARWSKQYQASETEKIEAMDNLIAWLPAQHPAGRRDAHRARRLPPRQRDLPPDRAAHPRRARLGAVDPRPSAGRLRLPLHDLAHLARPVPRPRRPRPRGARHPDRARLRRRLLPAHRPRRRLPSATGSTTWPSTCSASPASCRASWRARCRATPRAHEAIETGKRARPLAELAWRQVERLEAFLNGDDTWISHIPTRSRTCSSGSPPSWTSTSIRTRRGLHAEVEENRQQGQRLGADADHRGAQGRRRAPPACGTCSCPSRSAAPA